MSRGKLPLLALGLGLSAACSGVDDSGPELIYDQTTGRVVATFPGGPDGDVLMRVRRGAFGKLDCGAMAGELTAATGEGERFLSGPVDPDLLRPFYEGDAWLGQPTPAMLAQVAEGTDAIIDLCVMSGGAVQLQREEDLMRAWDRGRAQGLGGKADDPSGETRIHSVEEYGERCVAELGEIPFFEKQGDGEYGTYNCLDSVAIPMTVTDGAGNVTNPDAVVGKCDKPQYIYSLCEPGPRVASRTNDEGTRWVLLCRKSIGGYSSPKYNDIAMIGHNPYSGKTCYFQNALYSKTDGEHVPHPADKQKSANLWSGVHGGIGSGIECARCHDADAFIHSPWIDGARDANGKPVVPKMGIEEDLPLGANDAPYSIVNTAGQGWSMPKQLTSPDANACLKCHRIGDGRWLEWASRLDGTDSSFRNITTDEYLTFDKLHWMPPDVTGLTAETWGSSEYGRALDFIKSCRNNPASCRFEPIPGAPGGGGENGGALRNPVNLPDGELATKALQLLGANVDGSSFRCNECHSLTRSNLREWRTLTDDALGSCLSATTGGESRMENVNGQTVANGEFKTYGPYEVASGGTFEVHMTGSGDADLFVKKNAPVTVDSYDCRPYGSGSDETCGPGQFAATGPGKFYIGVSGYAAASEIALAVTYTAPGDAMNPPKAMVDCMRHDPASGDSPFVPGKIGIYAAAAHLGWFQDLFEAAYPQSWAVEYGKFKVRVGMPKGNHPKFTQDELDVVAEWFARGLPQLDSKLPEEPPPSVCTPSIGSALTTHVTAMQTQGWRAVNQDRDLRMQGCGASSNPRDCLTAYPRATSKGYGAGWEAQSGATLRVLRELEYNTFFWMRSSADGRFVANGATGGAGAMIADLQADKDIPTHAAYDPGFFPDNSGFVFQGTSIGAGFCTTALLTGGPAEITFNEPQCSSATGVGLYQHLGAGLGGGDYFVVNSQFTSDNGGHSATLHDPSASFASTAQIKLTPMVFDGSHYVEGNPVSFEAPFEGDSVLSPSTRLMVSRLSGPNSEQLGYVIRRVTATPNGSGYTVTAPEVARYCVQGAKPAISFDERFMVTHHYVDDDDAADLGFSSASDPEFQAYKTKGAANIIVVDLTTGARTRVTGMQPGQYALFPHFRSDGWIYFLVRDSNSGKEYVVASDAALELAE
jgi:hypothetical protein